jgi:hypothetical protein
LVGVTVKRIEIPKSIQSRLAVLGPNGFQFNGYLDDYRRPHRDRNPDGRGYWRASAGTNGDINYPIGMSDLLVMPKLGNNLSARRSSPTLSTASTQSGLSNACVARLISVTE